MTCTTKRKRGRPPKPKNEEGLRIVPPSQDEVSDDAVVVQAEQAPKVIDKPWMAYDVKARLRREGRA